ncbi:MAG: adenylosuccinate synthase [Bacteroidales bacterium]|jgi:adenylosuccinate synthase|nr:adenylosuccinate synthase [Bacteroidales bacterium]
MKVDVLLGLQWGDEGKGKIVDVFTPKYDIIARFQGGPNAGHTLEFNGEKHVLHTIPSGIFHPKTKNLIGNGVIIDPFIFKQEIEKLNSAGINPSSNLYISKKAHLILPTHRLLDAVYEKSKGGEKIGSTLKGIGPTYTDKVNRSGLRVGDILSESFEQKYNLKKENHLQIIKEFDFDLSEFKIDGKSFEEYDKSWLKAIDTLVSMKLVDSEHFVNSALKRGETVLAEGAQGTMLDIDFGSYPFVTSSNTIVSGVCSGLGVAPQKIGRVFGVFKAYCTRVGNGPFPTELHDEVGEELRKAGHEFGSTTGRPRRCGWLDLPALKYAIMLNGVTDLIVTKVDVLDNFDNINICNEYIYGDQKMDYFPYEINDPKLKPVFVSLKGWKTDITAIRSIENLPKELMEFVAYIEKQTDVPVSIISVGPDRTQTIFRVD